MECSSCHQTIPPDSQFCIHCGADLLSPVGVIETHDAVESNGIDEPPVGALSPGILTGTDGVHRWVFEMSMWRNSTIPKTIAKVVFISSMVPALLMMFLTLERGIGTAIRAFLEVAGLVLAIMAVLFLLAYILVSVVYGGKYCVAFEMDQRGVRHMQLQNQFKKGQVLSMLTVLAGLASGSPLTAGAGLLAGTRSSSYSDFSKVKSLVADPGKHVIYVDEKVKRNQVYVPREDFEAVLAYLADHCHKATVKRKN